MAALLIMPVVSVACGYFVFSKGVRQEHSRALKDFYRASKEKHDMFEASGFAVILVTAIFLSIFFVALLVMKIVNGWQ